MHRTILILPAFLFVSLLMTVGYALLGLGGPDTVLRQARHALDRGESGEALALLDLAVHDLENDSTGLLEQALRMRVSAYEKAGLKAKTLGDMRRLFEQLDVRDRDLMCTRIRILNELAREQRESAHLDTAEGIAEQWLKTHHDDSFVLAQVGITTDLRAEFQLDALLKTICGQTPIPSHERIGQLVRRAVYSTGASQEAARHLEICTTWIEQFVPGITGQTEADVQRIRDVALRAREYYVRSLATRRPMQAAFLALAVQLRAAQDDDTLLMVSHNFLRRAAPRTGLRAAATIALIHVRHQRYRAAEEIAERTLPLGTWRQRFLSGVLNHDALRLILCRAIAERSAGDENGCQALLAEIEKLKHGQDAVVLHELRAYPLLDLIYGVLISDDTRVRSHLFNFVNDSRSRKYDWEQDYLLRTAFRRLVPVAGSQERAAIIQDWRRVAPRDIEPVHALARHFIQSGRPEAAIPVLQNALAKLTDKDASLDLLVQAERAMFKGNIDQTIKLAQTLGNRVPDEIIAFPALVLDVARRALEIGAFDIALGCAERAQNLYPGTVTPYYLQAEIFLALGQPVRAGQTAGSLLDENPEDQRALALLTRARLDAGRPIDDLRFETLLRGSPDLPSSRFLARRWLEREEYDRVLTLCARAAQQLGADLELQILATRALMAKDTGDPREVLTMLKAAFQLCRGLAKSTPRERQLNRWVRAQYITKNPEQEDPAVLETMLDEFLVDCDDAVELVELASELADKRSTKLALHAYKALNRDDRYKAQRSGRHLIDAGLLAVRLDETTQARGMFAAALSFADGEEAVLHLAMLDQLSEREPTIDPAPKVDSIFAACVLRDAEKGKPYLIEKFEANPDDLGCQGALAVFAPETKDLFTDVVAVAREHGAELLMIIGLLQEPAYGRYAVERAEELVKLYPRNPVVQLLLARAMANSWRLGGVRDAINAAGGSLGKETLFLAEAMQILGASEHAVVRNSKIMDLLLGVITRQGAQAPPDLVAAVVRYNPAILSVPGVRPTILPLIAGFWLEHTELSGAGLPEVRILVDAGNHVTALRLLKKIERDLAAEDRADWLQLYYSAAGKFAPTAESVMLVSLVEEAIQVLKTEGVHGAPLHFILSSLDNEVRDLAGTPAGELAEQRLLTIEDDYLSKHVQYFLGGKDREVTNLERTMVRLGKRLGVEKVIQRVDEVLRVDPSLLPIWRLRAKWQVQLNHADEAVASLIWLTRYLENPETLDNLIQTLARAGILVERGTPLLAPNGLARASKFSLGLVQLRLGSYFKAVQSMALAPPQSDGAHLYFRAVGYLALQLPTAEQQAKLLLTELVSQYPKSRYVGPAQLILKIL